MEIGLFGIGMGIYLLFLGIYKLIMAMPKILNWLCLKSINLIYMGAITAGIIFSAIYSTYDKVYPLPKNEALLYIKFAIIIFLINLCFYLCKIYVIKNNRRMNESKI